MAFADPTDFAEKFEQERSAKMKQFPSPEKPPKKKTPPPSPKLTASAATHPVPLDPLHRTPPPLPHSQSEPALLSTTHAAQAKDMPQEQIQQERPAPSPQCRRNNHRKFNHNSRLHSSHRNRRICRSPSCRPLRCSICINHQPAYRCLRRRRRYRLLHGRACIRHRPWLRLWL